MFKVNNNNLVSLLLTLNILYTFFLVFIFLALARQMFIGTDLKPFGQNISAFYSEKNNNMSYSLIRTRMYVFLSRVRNDIFSEKFSYVHFPAMLSKGNLFLVSSSPGATVVFKK